MIMCFRVLVAIFGSAEVFVVYAYTKAYKTKQLNYSWHVEALQGKVMITNFLN
jgi:hypothetical protein